VSAAAAGVVRLDRARAEHLTAKLRDALDLAVELVRELHEHEAWRAMGYDSWPAYCAGELPQLRVIVRGMPKEERRAKVSELRAGGMSLRDVAEATGLAPNTVRTDSAGVQLVAVRGRDGALRSATSSKPAPAKRRPKTDRTVELLRERGPLTVLQVARELRCPQHKAAATLTRLEDAGRITYRRPERRGQFGAYVAGRIA
jgi:transposase